MKKPALFTLEESTISRLSSYSSETFLPKNRIVEIAVNSYLDEQKFELEKEQ